MENPTFEYVPTSGNYEHFLNAEEFVNYIEKVLATNFLHVEFEVINKTNSDLEQYPMEIDAAEANGEVMRAEDFKMQDMIAHETSIEMTEVLLCMYADYEFEFEKVMNALLDDLIDFGSILISIEETTESFDDTVRNFMKHATIEFT